MKPAREKRPAGERKRTSATRRGSGAVDLRTADLFASSEPPDVGERHAIEDEGCGLLREPQAEPDTAEAEMEPDDAIPFGPPDEPAPDAGEPPPSAPQARGAGLAIPKVRILSTAEIFAPMPPTAWLVRELQLAPGRPGLLYGSAGAGKTTIAQSLALFVAAGMPAWGQFPTRAGRVLHVDYDQGERPTRKRYKRLAAGHGIDLAALGDRLRFMPFPPVYLNSGELAEAFLSVHCADTALCVIDALRGALPRLDENDSRIGAHLAVCSRVSERTGTAFLVLHHLGKPKEGTSDSSMSPRGSSALVAASGAAILVTGGKDAPKRVRLVRDSESFDGGPSADFVLRFEDVPGGGDPAPLRVLYEGAAPAEGAEDKRAALDAAIVAHLRAHPACGVTAVRKAIGGNAEHVSQAIGALVDRGILRRESTARGAALYVVEREPDGEEEPDA